MLFKQISKNLQFLNSWALLVVQVGLFRYFPFRRKLEKRFWATELRSQSTTLLRLLGRTGCSRRKGRRPRTEGRFRCKRRRSCPAIWRRGTSDSISAGKGARLSVTHFRWGVTKTRFRSIASSPSDLEPLRLRTRSSGRSWCSRGPPGRWSIDLKRFVQSIFMFRIRLGFLTGIQKSKSFARSVSLSN